MALSSHALGDPFAEAVDADWPAHRWRDLNVVVALSGGADSVALLRALLAIKQWRGGAGRLIAGHLNHGLRGAESEADERWVRGACDELGVFLHCGRSEGIAASEESARDARYAFLRRAAAETGARYVATAHTRDDQVETILHRVFRGSGLAGVGGIPFERPLGDGVTLVRPLLCRSRAEVEAYLATLGQPYRNDASNADRSYTRNWLRHELLPLLRGRFGANVAESIIGLGDQAREAQQWLASEADTLAEVAFVVDAAGARITVERAPVRGAPPLLIREACRLTWRRAGWPEQAMGRQQWRQLELCLIGDDAVPAAMLPGGVRVEVLSDTVVLTRDNPAGRPAASGPLTP